MPLPLIHLRVMCYGLCVMAYALTHNACGRNLRSQQLVTIEIAAGWLRNEQTCATMTSERQTTSRK